MDALDLIAKRNELLQKLADDVKKFAHDGRELAQSEFEYRIALQKLILELRANGTPVTIINDVARGDYDVAKARLSRDIWQSSYDATRESINATKIAIKSVEAEIAREWNESNRNL